VPKAGKRPDNLMFVEKHSWEIPSEGKKGRSWMPVYAAGILLNKESRGGSSLNAYQLGDLSQIEKFQHRKNEEGLTSPGRGKFGNRSKGKIPGGGTPADVLRDRTSRHIGVFIGGNAHMEGKLQDFDGGNLWDGGRTYHEQVRGELGRDGSS